MSETILVENRGGREPSAYEKMRDSMPGGEDGHNDPSIGVLWRSVDRWRQHLRDQAAEIMEDPDLSDEGKQSKVEALVARLGPRIQQESKKAREKALKKAEAAEGRSIPGAYHERTTSDPQVHGNVLAESMELRERAAYLKETARQQEEGQVRRPEDVARGVQAATETGELAGTVTCQAVLRAAKTLGISPENVYDGLREQKHLDALEEARQYQMAADTISTRVPDVLNRGAVGQHHWKKAGTPRAFIPKGSPIAGGGKRRPS